MDKEYILGGFIFKTCSKPETHATLYVDQLYTNKNLSLNPRECNQF